jgi:hypothetical protein
MASLVAGDKGRFLPGGGGRLSLPILISVCVIFFFPACPFAQNSESIIADSIVPAQPVQPVAAATSLLAEDHKYDKGSSIDLSWVPSIDDKIANAVGGRGLVNGYRLYRITGGGEPVKIADLLPGANNFQDRDLFLDSTYSYYLLTMSDADTAMSVKTAAISPEREWINWNLRFVFLIGLVISLAVILYIETAKRGKEHFVRRIAGLEAVDDAIGRATEMGRPILYIPGIQDMDDVQTIAGLTILGRVASQIADYDTRIRMPVSRSLVMTAARETIKAAYQVAGRPDAYSDDMVSYVTDEQFGYVAAVDGIMVREKPATIFLLGAFFAESLILAETGNSIGAIQIAGTARPAQLPFFVAACDFTLIGEELFAASAYLSGEPKQLGSLKGQDVGKAIAMVAIVVGALSITLGTAYNFEFFSSVAYWLTRVFSTNG